MNKILIVAQRELLTRVKKKTFLLSTILLPLLIFGFYALIIYFSVGGDDNIKVAIADKANILDSNIKSNSSVEFVFLNNETESSLNSRIEKGEYDAYVLIPEGTTVENFDTIHLVSDKKMGLMTRDEIEYKLTEQVEEKRLMALNISKSQLDSIQNRKTHLNFQTVKGEKEDDIKAGISYGVGFISGFLIYLVLFIYGTMVMRGVMEEKVSRIAEVIISSVKPFQLMMGKILGIGAVGLLQFFIWILLITLLQMLLPLIFGMDVSSVQSSPMGGSSAEAASAFSKISENLSQINLPLIIGCFFFYFLGGYLLYSSLFAAVGSAVNEDPQDAQSLLLPVTMPIIFAFIIMMKAVDNPYSSISVFGSLFPFTSPIVMMARVAHGVPGGVTAWELIVSMALLILGFLGTTWMAGKIYRTGILMYGKKPTWKEMWNWAFRKA